MYIRKYVFPLLALTGMVAAAYTVSTAERTLAAAPPVVEPAPSPFELQIAGAGLIESASENVSIGTALSGLVVEVAVTEGQVVKRGDLLVRIDDRDRRAELVQREAECAAAEAELARLRALPRAEDLPPARARVETAKVLLEDARARLALAEAIVDKRAISMEELTKRRFAVATAEADIAVAQAELAKLEAGAWAPDVALAEARLRSAQAARERVKTELERLGVRAPIDGTCLQVHARAGEFATAGGAALVLLGDLSKLHVRIDIDESDAWRFTPGAAAKGFVRGNSQLTTPLEFVRVDPYVLPKRSLTGDTLERIDTRVLQVIYSFPKDALPVYVGQQMDVFLESQSGRGRQ